MDRYALAPVWLWQPKGVVYALVGILGLSAAFNWGGEVTGAKGGISNNCPSQPFGRW